jgi:hypothetical protein
MRAMAASDRERRSHFRGKPRPGRRVEVEYRLEGQPARSAFTRNIGVGGAFIVTGDERPPAPGTPVSLTLLVPPDHRLAVSAEVRWVVTEGDQPGMGVRFLALEVDELLELNEYFATLTGDDD